MSYDVLDAITFWRLACYAVLGTWLVGAFVSYAVVAMNKPLLADDGPTELPEPRPRYHGVVEFHRPRNTAAYQAIVFNREPRR